MAERSEYYKALTLAARYAKGRLAAPDAPDADGLESELAGAYMTGWEEGLLNGGYSRDPEVRALVEALRAACQASRWPIPGEVRALLDRYERVAVTERGVPGESQEPATEDSETGVTNDG